LNSRHICFTYKNTFSITRYHILRRVEPMPSERVDLARAATYVAAANVVVALAGVFYLAFATRLLPTVADFGTVSILGMTVSLLQAIVPLGLPQAVIKFLPEQIGRSGFAAARGVSIKGFRAGAVLAVICSTACFIFAPQLSSIFFGELGKADLLRLVAVDSFALGLSTFVSAPLLGLKRFKEYSIVNALANGGRGIAAVLFLVLGLGISGVLLAWIIFDFLGLFIMIYLTRDVISGRAPDFPLDTMAKYGAPLYGSTLLTFFQSTIDKYVVFGLAGSAALGLYTPAIAAVTYIMLIPTSIVGVTFPRICEAYGRGNLKEITHISNITSKYVGVIYVPLALGLASVANPAIEMFAGNRYAGGAPTLAIVSAFSALICFGAILNNVIMSINKTHILFAANFLAIGAGAAVSLIMVPPLGATGASIGRTSLLIVQFLVPLLYLCRVHLLSLNWRVFLKALAASSVMAAAVLAMQCVIYIKYLLPFYMLIGAVIYLAMVRFLRIADKDDTAFFIAYLPRQLRGMGAKVERFVLGSQQGRPDWTDGKADAGGKTDAA